MFEARNKLVGQFFTFNFSTVKNRIFGFRLNTFVKHLLSLTIQTSMDELRPLDMEKPEFELQDRSILIPISGMVVVSGMERKKENGFFLDIIVH